MIQSATTVLVLLLCGLAHAQSKLSGAHETFKSKAEKGPEHLDIGLIIVGVALVVILIAALYDLRRRNSKKR